MNHTDEPWPFDQPPNCAVISLRKIVSGGSPILHVTHDEDDHGWQFLEGENPDVDEAVVVSFKRILDLDPSIYELADLPPGWHAWRGSVNDPWTHDTRSETHEMDTFS